MVEQHKPGENVQTSGIYKAVKEGEHFPPTRSGKGAHYEFVHGATHSHKHSKLGSGDK